MTAIFPAHPGLGWSDSKTPRFATRVQRAVSGRELRVLDQPNPIWTWTLTYSMLRDKNDTRAAKVSLIGMLTAPRRRTSLYEPYCASAKPL